MPPSVPKHPTSGSVAGAKYKGSSRPFACFDSVVSILILPCPLWEGEMHTAPQTAYPLLKGGNYQGRPCLASDCASAHRSLPDSVFSAEFCGLPYTSSANNPDFLTLVIALQDPRVATPSSPIDIFLRLPVTPWTLNHLGLQLLHHLVTKIWLRW